MTAQAPLISLATRYPVTLVDIQRSGISVDDFTGDNARAWKFILAMKDKHGSVPSPDIIERRYPDIEVLQVRRRDLPVLIAQLREETKFRTFLKMLDKASQDARTPDDLEAAMGTLTRTLMGMSMSNGGTGIVDLFSDAVSERMMETVKARRRGEAFGIQTGLKRFDAITGGLQKGRMHVAMARSGFGKTWMNLLFVTQAVRQGHKVMLYPLEMTLEETAFRLYTLLSCGIWGVDKAIKNLDLTLGRVTPRKVVRLLGLLEDRFAGQLFVADIASSSAAYTIERINAEVEVYQPDMFWVDYLTLMKAPGIGANGADDHHTVKALSNGIKHISLRHNVVGGCSAQINREAIKTRSILPRLEHIAFGDSIGHDCDIAVSLGRDRKFEDSIVYGVVKNRHGPEFGKTRLRWNVDVGDIADHDSQYTEDEDE